MDREQTTKIVLVGIATAVTVLAVPAIDVLTTEDNSGQVSN